MSTYIRQTQIVGNDVEWQQAMPAIVAWLVCCWPVGLIMMLGNKQIPRNVKTGICIALGTLVLLVIIVGGLTSPPPARHR